MGTCFGRPPRYHGEYYGSNSRYPSSYPSSHPSSHPSSYPAVQTVAYYPGDDYVDDHLVHPVGGGLGSGYLHENRLHPGPGATYVGHHGSHHSGGYY